MEKKEKEEKLEEKEERDEENNEEEEEEEKEEENANQLQKKICLWGFRWVKQRGVSDKTAA